MCPATQIFSFPSQISKQIHTDFLKKLRDEFVLIQNLALKNENSKDLEIEKIRIRSWQFMIEDGTPTLDVFLDKGYIDHQLNARLTFDECAFVHNAFLETGTFDIFSDKVEIRFGSPGSEPILEDLCDYQCFLNKAVKIETLNNIQDRSKFILILVEIFSKEDDTVIALKEGDQRLEIPLSQIKIAYGLPFHSLSSQTQKGKTKVKKLNSK